MGRETERPLIMEEQHNITEKDKFKFDQAGAVFEFNPTEKAMLLFQGGGQIEFTKE